MSRRGLALILVVGVLGVLAVLGSAFAVLSRLERKAASLRVQGTQAFLLARSGLEDAAARLGMGQDPVYAGEDWNLNSFLDAGEDLDPASPGTLDSACSLRFAQRPSFFVQDPSAGGYPALFQGRGRSGGFGEARSWALKVEDLNGRIFVNGGSGNDVSMSGPNGFLVRLLDNLDIVVTGTSGLGTELVSARPPRGYARMEDLQAVLPAARYARLKGFLTTEAWVDPEVARPQLVDLRPNRWLDVDDKHRIGADPLVPISGVAPVSAVSGDGTQANPWSQELIHNNRIEGSFPYRVYWERGFLYAWRQLRLAPAAMEPRAPVALNTATTEVLAAVFVGLKGVHLDVWEGSAGWEGGFGWYVSTQTVSPAPMPPAAGSTYTYPTPADATEPTPWIRTRLDHGMGYGPLPGTVNGSGNQPRTWYGPADYDPTATSFLGSWGKPLIQCSPLGRLKESAPLSPAQARAIAQALRDRIDRSGPFRTWMDFNAFVDALPSWEEPDGASYPVTGSAGSYNRRTYRRGDADSDGVLDQQTFAGGVQGLTFVQKDVIRAMANPNTDVNDFNPDANLWKEVDKTDLGGIGSQRVSGAWQDDPDAFVHTTELCLDAPSTARIRSLGRAPGASRQLRATAAFSVHRDTTQADFMRDFTPPGTPATALFEGGWAGNAPYPLAGEQPLVSYPEPQTTVSGGPRSANAVYDGQIGLGFAAGEYDGQNICGSLFDSLNAVESGDLAVEDAWGPFQEPLVGPAGAKVGNLFPDGAYSEKDATLKFAAAGNMLTTRGCWAFWVKPNWFPEASPRAHCLTSVNPSCKQGGGTTNIAPFGVAWRRIPMDDIRMRPYGLYFVPARNNFMQDDLTGTYAHNLSDNQGWTWPARSLLWGTTHVMFFSESMNRKGNPTAASRPVGRLEAHRWQHIVAMSGQANVMVSYFTTFHGMQCLVGKRQSDPSGVGGGRENDVIPAWTRPLNTLHWDGTASHWRLGEIAGHHNMNYTADATFANVSYLPSGEDGAPYYLGMMGGNVPDVLGRHFKEPRAAFRSAALPRSLRALRATWTEIPCDLRFDRDGDAWLDAVLENDLDADGRRDVRIELEIHDDLGLLARFEDPAAPNIVPGPRSGPLRYKAVFVNAWDSTTRVNQPLDVTPFLDDVSLVGGLRFLAWEDGDEG